MAATASLTRRPCNPSWGDNIPDEEWAAYEPILRGARVRGIPFALGGGLVFSAYAGRWRWTKDLDLIILARDRDPMVEILTGAGFSDYYDQLPYDRAWIYRGFRNGLIVDLIWEMANHHDRMDESWLRRGREAIIHGTRLKMLAPEELIWLKLFVVQRDRCDWPDILSVLNFQADRMDWEHLLDLVGDESGLLGGLLSVFRWMCPRRARAIPESVWRRVGLDPGFCAPGRDGARAPLLDTRDWFGPTDEDEPCR